MEQEYYVQCKFKRGVVSTETPYYKETVAWIPEWAAKVGNNVQLLSLDGKLWQITEAGKIRKPKSEVKEDERAHKDFQASLKGGGID